MRLTYGILVVGALGAALSACGSSVDVFGGDDDGEGGEGNAGNTGNLGNVGNGGSGNQGNIGNGGSGNQGNVGNGGSGNQGNVGNGGSGNQGNVGNGGSGNQGNVGNGGSGGGPITCHDECSEGPPMQPVCSPCVSSVCSQDPYCCDTFWDLQCVSLAEQVCGIDCGGGGCATCSDMLNGSPEAPCPGSDALFDAFLTCVCFTSCSTQCQAECNGSGGASATCQSCASNLCDTELAACFNDA
jgi:hypothetical protein